MGSSDQVGSGEASSRWCTLKAAPPQMSEMAIRFLLPEKPSLRKQVQPDTVKQLAVSCLFALRRHAAGSGTPSVHYHNAGKPWAVGPLWCPATMLGGSGQWDPAGHCHTAGEQWAGGLPQCTTTLLRSRGCGTPYCTVTLLGSSGQWESFSMGADPGRDPTPKGGGGSPPSTDPKIVARNNVLCRRQRRRRFCIRHTAGGNFSV